MTENGTKEIQVIQQIPQTSIVYYTAKASEATNPALVLLEKNITITDTLTAPIIANMLAKDNETKAIEQALSNSIIQVLRHMLGYFNAKHTMNDQQIWAFSHDFIRKYPTDSIEDLVMCLREARTGKYGKDFNRIDGIKIFEWYAEYLDEKLDIIEAMNSNEKHQKVEVSDEVTAQIKSTLESNIKEQKKKPAPPDAFSMTLEAKIEQFEMYAAHYTDDEVHSMYLTYEHHGKRFMNQPDIDKPIECQPGPFDDMLWAIMVEVEKRLADD